MFLSSRELVWCEIVWLVFSSMVVASPIYSGIGPLPKCKAGRDPTTAKFERGQEVHLILTKVVFACKASGLTLRWAQR